MRETIKNTCLLIIDKLTEHPYITLMVFIPIVVGLLATLNRNNE
jgi:hypothetical protein